MRTSAPSTETGRIVLKFRAACVAASRASGTNAAADEFFDEISKLSISDPVTSAPGDEAFASVIAQVEMLRPEHAFEPTMIAAETLAGCVLRSPEYLRVLRAWARRERGASMAAVARACSKLADFDRARIDMDVLLDLASRLDAQGADSGAEATALGYVARVAGKLKNTSEGVRLIEHLASLGPQCRIHAAHAIAFDIALGPPASHLSLFATLNGAPPRSERPESEADLAVRIAASRRGPGGRCADTGCA